jgi:hypothetical protein
MADAKFAKQLAELRNGLVELRKSGRDKIGRKSLQKSMPVVVKAIKELVPPNLKGMKKAIGHKMLKKVKGEEVKAKVGAAVGKKQKAIEKQAGFRAHARKGRPGVGIGPENIHWFLLGTKERKREFVLITGRRTFRQSKKGFSTGKMPPQAPDLIARGVMRSLSAAHAKRVSVAKAELEKETARLKAKVNAKK